MKPILSLILLGSFSFACGQGGLNTQAGFTRDSFSENSEFDQLEARLDQAGNLVLTNKVYKSWNGVRLQGNEDLSVIAVD